MDFKYFLECKGFMQSTCYSYARNVADVLNVEKHRTADLKDIKFARMLVNEYEGMKYSSWGREDRGLPYGEKDNDACKYGLRQYCDFCIVENYKAWLLSMVASRENGLDLNDVDRYVKVMIKILQPYSGWLYIDGRKIAKNIYQGAAPGHNEALNFYLQFLDYKSCSFEEK